MVDEAYVAFGGVSCCDLVKRFDNLIVIRTLSKSHGLAGLRVGYALAAAKLIEALERVKNSFNSYPLDRLAIAGAVAAIEDQAHFAACRARVIASRERLLDALGDLGFTSIPSVANFVFATHHERPAVDIAQALRERAILVRHFADARIDNYLRITVGTDDEIDQLIATLGSILD